MAASMFTYGNSNVDSLLTTTRSVITDMGDFLANQIFNDIPLLNWLQQKANIRKSGGASLLVPLMYAKNGTFQWYSGYDILDTTPQEGLTVAQYKWKNGAASITISGEEERQNAGEGQLYSLIKGKTEQAMMTMKDSVDSAFFASSQATKAIQTLVTLVDATSTIGDINSTSASWWQAQVTVSGSFSGRGIADMLTMYNTIKNQGADGGVPDLLLTTQTVMEYYERSQAPQMRYSIVGGNMPLANAGFDSLKYKAATMTSDPNCTSGVMYFLSSKNLKFVTHSAAQFSVGEFKKPVNQDARTAQILFMGNLLTNNRRKLGKLTTISA